MSLLTGRNATTNKISVINLDDDGKIKLDESNKITDIDSKLQTISNDIVIGNTQLGALNTISTNLLDVKNYVINRSLPQLRNEGHCFVITQNFNSTNQSRNMISIANGLSSAKKIYIYRIIVSADTDSGGNFSFKGNLRVGSVSGGTTITPQNLQIGGVGSSMTCKTNYSYTSSTLLITLFNRDEPSALFADFKFDEYIELPQNQTIHLEYTNTTTSNRCFYNASIFYFEVPSTEEH